MNLLTHLPPRFRPRHYLFEFARPISAYPVVTLSGVVLLLLAVGWAVFEWRSAEVQRQHLQQLELQIAQLTPVHDKPVTVSTVKALPKPVVSALQTQVNAATVQLQTHWFSLLAALEQAQNRDIALLQLLPDAPRARFSLTGEAKNYQALLKYVSALQATSTLAYVHLQKHQVNETHPQQPVQFEIEGAWQP